MKRVLHVKALRRLILFVSVAAVLLTGAVLMIQATEDDPAPTTSIAGHNLSIVSNVQIGYYVTEKNVPSGAERGVLVFDGPRASYEYGDEDFRLTDRYTSGSYSVYYLEGLSLYQMTDTVYAVSFIKVGDDITYGFAASGNVDKYSVLEYCHRYEYSTTVPEGGHATLGRLVVSIENMGAVAQQYADHRTDFLATDAVSLVRLNGAHFADGTNRQLAAVGTALTFYADGDGVLYFTDGTGTRGCYAASATYAVPATDVTVTARGASAGLLYVSNGDGTCSVVGIGDCADAAIVIPETHDGDTVTSIGPSAFEGGRFTAVCVPAGVGEIGDGAFDGCDLTETYYAGTRAGWAVLLENVGTGNAPLTGATLRCADDGPAAAGFCAHTRSETAAVSPTCTQPGHIGFWYCADCDRYFTDPVGRCELTLADTVIPATGHTPTDIPGTGPTCTATGLTDGKICPACGEVFVAQTEIPATGHSFDGDIDLCYRQTGSAGQGYFKTYSVRDPLTEPDEIYVPTQVTVHANAASGKTDIYTFPSEGHTVRVFVNGVEADISDGLTVSARDTVTCTGGEIVFRVKLENYQPSKRFDTVNWSAVGDSLTAKTQVTLTDRTLETLKGYAYWLWRDSGIIPAYAIPNANKGFCCWGRDGSDLAMSSRGYLMGWQYGTNYIGLIEQLPHEADVVTVFGSINDASFVHFETYRTDGEFTFKGYTEEGNSTVFRNQLLTLNEGVLSETSENGTYAGVILDTWRRIHEIAPYAKVVVIPSIYGLVQGLDTPYNEPGGGYYTSQANAVGLVIRLAELFRSADGNDEWFYLYNFTFDTETYLFIDDPSDILYNGNPASYYNFRNIASAVYGDASYRYAYCDAQCVHPRTAYHEEYLWHKFDEAITTALYGSASVVAKTCTVCGGTVIGSLTHTPVSDPAVAPTCLETGLTEGSHCAVCQKILTPQTVLPAEGHTPVSDPAAAPTCLKTGLTEGSHCAVCQVILTPQTVLPVGDHTPVSDPAVAPTCLKTGLTGGSHCAVCQEILTPQTVLPIGDHTPVSDPAVPATCTETGLTGGSHCGVCGEVFVAQTVIPALGHRFDGDIDLCYRQTGPAGQAYYKTYSVRDPLTEPTDINVPASVTVHANAASGKADIYTFPTEGHTVRVFVNGVEADISDGLTVSAHDTVTCAGGEIVFRVTLSGYVPEKPYDTVNYVAFGDSLTAIQSETPIGQSEQEKLNYVYWLWEEKGINPMNADPQVNTSVLCNGRDGTAMAYSGTGYVKGREQVYGWYNRSTKVPHDADVVTVFGSVNDIPLPINVGSNNPPAYATRGVTVTTGLEEGFGNGNAGCRFLRGADSTVLGDTRSDNTVAGEMFDVWREIHEQAPFAKVVVVPALYAAGIGLNFSHTTEGSNPESLAYACLKNSVRTTLLFATLFEEENGDWFSVYNFTYDLDADGFMSDPSEKLYSGHTADYYDFRNVNPWLFKDDVTDADLSFAVTYSDIKYDTVAAFDNDFCPIHPLTAYYREYLWYKFDEAIGTALYGNVPTVTVTCTVCGEAVIGSLTHTPVSDPAVAPTCLETGLTEGSHCAVCQKILTPQTVLPVGDHTPVSDPDVPATCTETGLTGGSHCGVCGTVLEAPITVGPKGHSPITVPGRAATCTAPGLTGGTACSVCGITLTGQTEIPPRGHGYENGICVRCGVRYVSQGLTFTSNGDGTCSVTDTGTCTDTDLVIPSVSPDGDAVTAIGNLAFYNCKELTSVTIPDSVTGIGSLSFANCKGLTSMVIPDSVTDVGTYAFYKCGNLCSVTLGDGLTSIGSYAFSYCLNLDSVTVPDCVTDIGDSAFRNCAALTSIIIPDSVTNVGESAFRDCDGLTIYCAAPSKPAGWASDWNYSDCPVVWGYSA